MLNGERIIELLSQSKLNQTCHVLEAAQELSDELSEIESAIDEAGNAAASSIFEGL